MNLDSRMVLRLNRNWQAIGISTIKDALIAMNSGDAFLKAATALDITFQKDEDGEWDFSSAPDIIPVSFDTWVTLPIRDYDAVVHTTKLKIRVPTVIIAQNYSKVHMVGKTPNNKTIWERDEGICQITGKRLTKKTGNIDHDIPRSRGGKDTFENMLLMDSQLNSLKGDRTLAEMGWTPIRKPFAPKQVPVSSTITELKVRDWKYFIEHEQ